MNLTEKKMLPVGIEDFREMRTENYYYVDKTAMISDLLRRRGKVNLFTRPRRFGKSLNMSMLQYFLEYGCQESFFAGLDISRDTAACEKYMGSNPVVSISLKSVNGSDYETARALICSVISEEALRFYDILSASPKLNEAEQSRYHMLINPAMSDVVLMGSLKTLSALLHKHYGKPAVILIDEYDVPLAKAHEQGYYDRILLLIRSLFEQALKTNGSLYFAVLTGCLRISKESVFTGLNNPKIFSITDVDCDSYFGFTDTEVKVLLNYYELGDQYDDIKEWYDGYRFGDSDVYCPWDVVNYVDKLLTNPTLPPQDYWSNTSSNDIVRHFLEMAAPDTRDEIERLIAGETVWKKISDELTYKDLYQSIENMWSVLFTTGYLTQKGDIKDGFQQLSIPNREIHNIFMKQIRSWMQEKVRQDPTRLDKFCEAVEHADGGTMQAIFSEYLNETISIRDTAVRNDLKENFYHGFLLGLLRSRNDWKVLSNRESGRGYTDILIEIFSKKLAIIIEIKYPANGDLDAGCRDALRQIDASHYTDQPLLDGMTNIIKCGVACYSKNCKIRFEP